MDVTAELDMIEAIRFEYNSKDQLQRHKHLPPIVANTKNLRWIEWEGDLASPLLTNFPQRTLCHLVLNNSSQKQLWEGYKLLPNLKTIVLDGLGDLIMTPDFDGVPNLERFVVYNCGCLEEIHPSVGCLERLVLLSMYNCPSLEKFPPTTRLQKLETLSFASLRKLFKLPENQQQNMDNLGHLLHLDDGGSEVASNIESSTNVFVDCWRCDCCNLGGVECCLQEPSLPLNNMKLSLHDNMNHIGLQFFLKDLRKLDLRFYDLGDEEMGSAVWELPNLQKLNLVGNKISQLNFSLLQVPRLKWLNVTDCTFLVELSELPQSIAVVIAEYCPSLESFGDVSNCQWLWYVSVPEENKLVSGILLDSMLQGNAIEDYFINIILKNQIPKRFVGRLFRRSTFTLHLPDDWYNDFCGFLICSVTQEEYQDIKIVIKQEIDEDSVFELWEESIEALEPEYECDGTTCVGYVSFGSLRQATLLNSSYNIISFSIVDMFSDLEADDGYVGAELIPRTSKGDPVQTTNVATDSSEFFDEEDDYRRLTFRIQYDSKSSINILWRPYDHGL